VRITILNIIWYILTLEHSLENELKKKYANIEVISKSEYKELERKYKARSQDRTMQRVEYLEDTLHNIKLR
jgi:hypothetical protein